jgi:hypothetical protein
VSAEVAARPPAAPAASRPALLLQVLGAPGSVTAFTPRAWDLLLRQGRRADLLARLEVRLAEHGVLDAAPSRVRDHFWAASAVVAQVHRLVRWEVGRLRRGLAGLGVPIVLLKGAAYLMADLPVARGRLFSDVDVLVPREALDAVERQLLAGGWHFAHLDAYDERYYRVWMHELPPLVHRERQIAVDVHHAILPPTGRLRPDSSLLLAASRALPDAPLRVLAPSDMVLHAAAHMFQDGDLHGELRDLVDLDAMLRDFAADPAFWPGLVPRARALGLGRPLFYALRYARRLLATPVPRDAYADARAEAPAAVAALMDALVERALVPHLHAQAPWTTRASRWLLYARSHWLRMPPLLLARHLLHKALTRPVYARGR